MSYYKNCGRGSRRKLVLPTVFKTHFYIDTTYLGQMCKLCLECLLDYGKIRVKLVGFLKHDKIFYLENAPTY
jgi:hypothetical protein